ncbi:hypothetical protein BV20DRAFT_340423 [Pilatotrama ljubarskyi]|nr:hypothetical protein BV20DRAFT_340423 [Pilatotrama ljubarskyi]
MLASRRTDGAWEWHGSRYVPGLNSLLQRPGGSAAQCKCRAVIAKGWSDRHEGIVTDGATPVDRSLTERASYQRICILTGTRISGQTLSGIGISRASLVHTRAKPLARTCKDRADADVIGRALRGGARRCRCGGKKKRTSIWNLDTRAVNEDGARTSSVGAGRGWFRAGGDYRIWR